MAKESKADKYKRELGKMTKEFENAKTQYG